MLTGPLSLARAAVALTGRRVEHDDADPQPAIDLADGDPPIDVDLTTLDDDRAPFDLGGRHDLLRGGSSAWIGPVLLLLAVTLWTVGILNGIAWREMTDLGFVTVVPLVGIAGLVLLAVAFAVAVARLPVQPWLWPSCVTVLVLVLHGTPTLVYGTLRYPWAYKHLGVVDYITRHGSVDPSIDTLAVYHGWPGFFSLHAMLAEAVGLDDLAGIARWWPVGVNLVAVVALAAIARCLVDDDRVVAVTCWVFVMASWVGQDYFSPQALGFVLYLSLLAIVLRVLALRRLHSPGGGGPGAAPQDAFVAAGRTGGPYRPPAAGMARHLRRQGAALLGRFARSVRRAVRLRGQRPSGLALVVGLPVVAIASSHQLTPFMVVLVLAALAGIGYAGTMRLPVLAAAATVAWAFAFALPLLVGNADEAAAIGAVGDNVRGTLTDLDVVSTGAAVVALSARALTGVVLLLAGLGLLRTWVRHGRWPGVLVVLMGTPALLVGLSGYGDEILFRVVLFTVPAASIAIALLLVEHRRRIAGAVAVLAATAVLLPGFLLAHLGTEPMYAFSPEEVAVVRALHASAPEGALLVEASRNYPAQVLRYEVFTYVPIDREPPATRRRIVADPATELEKWLSDDDAHTASYLLLTRSMRMATERLGTLPEGGFETIRRSVEADPRFVALVDRPDAAVFVLRESLARTPPIEVVD